MMVKVDERTAGREREDEEEEREICGFRRDNSDRLKSEP